MNGQRRHILVMSSWFPSRIDVYAGNFVQRFASLLTQNYDVTVIHTMGDKKSKRFEVVEEKIDKVRTILIYHPVSTNKVLHWWFQRRALRKALALVEEVDLVFAHVLLPRGLQFVKAKKYFNCPLIVMEHASYYRTEMHKRLTRLQRTIIQRTSRHIQQVVAVSDVLRTDMKQLFPTTRIEIIPNFIEDGLFPVRSISVNKKQRFLHVSTLDRSTKNPQLLLQGFQKAIQEEQLDIHLTIVSDQPTSHWQKWVEEQKLTNHISFVGPASWEEIGAFMHEHDVFVLTSNYETFSIVLAEAWSTGMPVITTSVGIAKDMPSHLGILIPKDDAVGLAHAISEMHDGNQTFDPKTLHAFAHKFHASTVLKKLDTLFETYFDQHD